MEIYLDDQPVAIENADTLTIRDAASELRPRLDSNGRMLTQIRCDGETVDPARLDAVLDSPASSFGTIEFLSSDARDLCRRLLVEVSATFDEADAKRHEAANLLDAGQTVQAMTILGDCVRSWSQIHEAIVQSSRTLGIDLESYGDGNINVGIWLAGLTERLGALKEALQAGDHVSVADILRYEFDDITSQWKQVVGALLEQTAA